MSISASQRRAVAKYNAKAYDSFSLRVPKGQLDAITSHAQSNGESTNGFIKRAIIEAMENDKKKNNQK